MADQTSPLLEAGSPGAGVLRRLSATLLDMAVFCAATAGILLPLFRRVDWSRAVESFDAFVAAVSEPSVTQHAAGLFGIWVGLWWAYFVIGWGMCGATPGKWLAGVRIVDHNERCPIGVSRALLRLAAYCASSVTFGLGHALIAFRRDRRALHDILAGTRVVRVRRVTAPQRGRDEG